jgi:hypothetical protein
VYSSIAFLINLGLGKKLLSPAAAWYFSFLYVLFSPSRVKKEHTESKKSVYLRKLHDLRGCVSNAIIAFGRAVLFLSLCVFGAGAGQQKTAKKCK